MNSKYLICIFIILSFALIADEIHYNTYEESIGNNDFLIAVGNNDSLKIRQMLINNFDPNYKNKLGLSALRISVENKFHNITRILEQFGAVYDDTSKFISAIDSNDLITAEELLRNGVSPNVKIFRQAYRELFHYWSIDYPILIATKNHNVNLLNLLLKYNVDLNVSNSKTALMIAADLGFIDLTEILLSHGANIDETVDFTEGSNSGTALKNAINCNNLEIVRFLLENGANIEISDFNNAAYSSHTPLMLAIQNNNFEAVKLLVEFSADVNKKDVHGSSIMDYAKTYASLEIIEFLIDQGAK